MRNPARKALYCFLALLVSAALIRYGALRLERIEEDLRGAGAVALGLAIGDGHGQVVLMSVLILAAILAFGAIAALAAFLLTPRA
jgi:hypothetical protein